MSSSIFQRYDIGAEIRKHVSSAMVQRSKKRTQELEKQGEFAHDDYDRVKIVFKNISIYNRFNEEIAKIPEYGKTFDSDVVLDYSCQGIHNLPNFKLPIVIDGLLEAVEKEITIYEANSPQITVKTL